MYVSLRFTSPMKTGPSAGCDPRIFDRRQGRLQKNIMTSGGERGSM